jgi:hypothetical protein
MEKPFEKTEEIILLENWNWIMKEFEISLLNLTLTYDLKWYILV